MDKILLNFLQKLGQNLDILHLSFKTYENREYQDFLPNFRRKIKFVLSINQFYKNFLEPDAFSVDKKYFEN